MPAARRSPRAFCNWEWRRHCPGKVIGGDAIINGTLDLNGLNQTMNGLSGAGVIDTIAGGTPVLTLGANGNGGTFTGTIQNSSGNLTVLKVGAGTQFLNGISVYSGATVVAGGTLGFIGANVVRGTPGSLVVSNAALTVDASGGVPMQVGSLTLGDNSTNNFSYGTVSANPTVAAINVVGGVTAREPLW